MKIGTKISAALCLAFCAALVALLPSYLALVHARSLFLASFPPEALMPGTRAGEVNDWLMIGIAASVLGAVGIFAVFFTIAIRAGRSIVAPLQVIASDLTPIGQGDFSPPAVLKRKDEIGTLSRAVGDMVAGLDLLMQDVKSGRARLAESEARFRDFAEASADWLWETDAAGRVTFFSGQVGYGPEFDSQTLLGKPFDVLVSVRLEDGTTRQLELGSRRPIRDLICAYDDGTGKDRSLLLSGSAVIDDEGAFQGYRGVARDITDDVAARHSGRMESQVDVLTGLSNRDHTLECLRHALDSRRWTKADVAVLHIDLDRFKAVIDAHGQETADEVLQSVADRLRAHIGPDDTLGRLEEDAFVIIQVARRQPDAVEALCQTIRDSMTEIVPIDGPDILLSASIGCAIAGNEETSAENLLRNAEIAMYRAKDDGRDTHRYHDSQMTTALIARQSMERELAAAIEAGGVEVLYQPIVGAGSRIVAGFEASLHWPRTGHGLVPAGDLLALAESAQLTGPLGLHLLRTACRNAVRWPDARMTVSLMDGFFRDASCLEKVSSVLRDTNLDPRRLDLAIGEGTLCTDHEDAQFRIDGLRDLYVGITLDQFGAEAASLRQLQRFGVDRLRLDQSFLSACGRDPSTPVVLQSIVNIGYSLGIDTTATGVSLETEADQLAVAGCTELQGDLFGKPMTSARIDALLRTHGAAAGENSVEAGL